MVSVLGWTLSPCIINGFRMEPRSGEQDPLIVGRLLRVIDFDQDCIFSPAL